MLPLMLPVIFSNSCEAAVDENSPFRNAVLLALCFLVCVVEVFILRAALPVFRRSYEACWECCLRLNLFDYGFLFLSFETNDSDIIGAGGFLMET